MMISTKGRYALRVMIELAGAQGTEYVALKDIARNQGISEKYLEAIMKRLVQKNLVEGVRGKGGGYRLAQVPELCTAWDILGATENTMVPVSCLERGAEECPRRGRCATLPMWRGLDRVIRDYFQGITLAQLCDQARRIEEDSNWTGRECL